MSFGRNSAEQRYGKVHMKTLNILHLGIGNVGKEVLKQITEQREQIIRTLEVSLEYSATFTSKNSEDEIVASIQKAPLPFVLIDTTTSDKIVPYLLQTLKRGGSAVLANKRPLSSSQKDFEQLQTLGKDGLLYECTVGAGLPVIRLLQDLLMTGDDIIEIQGCFSGTLGFIFSALEKGMTFSEAVRQAKEKGFTEFDPREDLSGKDVARKALILARLLGQKKEMQDIDITSLYAPEMQSLTVEEFMETVSQLDKEYAAKVMKAKKAGKALRFVARVTKQECSVGLQEVATASNIGRLTGPDNIIVFKTKRYNTNPIVIKGPGAGIEVTAAGVFADVIEIAKRLG